MLPCVSLPSITLPPISAPAEPVVPMRFVGFSPANIRNDYTRLTYAKAVRDFLIWCFVHGVRNEPDFAPVHVAAWIEISGQPLAPPSV